MLQWIQAWSKISFCAGLNFILSTILFRTCISNFRAESRFSWDWKKVSQNTRLEIFQISGTLFCHFIWNFIIPKDIFVMQFYCYAQKWVATSIWEVSENVALQKVKSEKRYITHTCQRLCQKINPSGSWYCCESWLFMKQNIAKVKELSCKKKVFALTCHHREEILHICRMKQKRAMILSRIWTFESFVMFM